MPVKRRRWAVRQSLVLAVPLGLISVGLLAWAQEKGREREYHLEKISAPDPQASLLDFEHHFRVRLAQEGKTAVVEFPIRPELLSAADLNTLRLGYYDRQKKS